MCQLFFIKKEVGKDIQSDGQPGTERMINGNNTNLRDWNRIKHGWAHKLYRIILNNFWIPEEIPLSGDAKQFQELSAQRDMDLTEPFHFSMTRFREKICPI